jgi:hypothetical protein
LPSTAPQSVGADDEVEPFGRGLARARGRRGAHAVRALLDGHRRGAEAHLGERLDGVVQGRLDVAAQDELRLAGQVAVAHARPTTAVPFDVVGDRRRIGPVPDGVQHPEPGRAERLLDSTYTRPDAGPAEVAAALPEVLDALEDAVDQLVEAAAPDRPTTAVLRPRERPAIAGT